MNLEEINNQQILDFLKETPVKAISYSEITELAKIVAVKITKPSHADTLTTEELLNLLKEINLKRVDVVNYLRLKITSHAKVKSEIIFIRAKNEIELKLNPSYIDIIEFLNYSLNASIKSYNRLGFWNVQDRFSLRKKVNDALLNVYIPESESQIEVHLIPEKLTFILSEQYARIKKISYLKALIASYDKYLDTPNATQEPWQYRHEIITPLDKGNLPPNEASIMSAQTPKIFAWHYAIALALLQQSGVLTYTIGKKKDTIDQARHFFKCDRDDSLPENIYDSIKKMKYPRNEQDWDVNYALEHEFTKRRRNYKQIVKNLLSNNASAIALLDTLIN